MDAVFQTELVAIKGVEPPKQAEAEAEPAAEEEKPVGEGVAEKIASVAAEAADAAKTMAADTDDMQGHEEL